METLTSFGPAGAVVAVVWLFFKYLVPAIDRLSDKVEKSMAVDREMLKFMKNLNGELKKAAEKKLSN